MPPQTPADEGSGLRFSWNLFPADQDSSTSSQVPLGCLLQPFSENIKLVHREGYPLRAKSGACLNYASNLDMRMKTWDDNFTGSRNPLPPAYANWISEQNILPEMSVPVVEYTLHDCGQQPVYFLLLIDTCVFEEEFESLKVQLQKFVGMLPSHAEVGLVTYGKNLHVYELGFTKCRKAVVVRGDNGDSTDHVRTDTVAAQLGLNSQTKRKFFVNVGTDGHRIDSILEDLQTDSWDKMTECRHLRCTGMACHVALSMMELICANKMGRIMLFGCGPCTYGPGKIADVKLKHSLRQHHDIHNSSKEAENSSRAIKFYQTLSERVVASGHAFDMMISSLDQVGYYEMRTLCERSGGYVVMTDTFSSHQFGQSLDHLTKRDVNGDLKQMYNAKITVFASKDLAICGGVGPMASNRQLTPSGTGGSSTANSVSENCVGEGATCVWSAGGIDEFSSFAFYFEVTNTTPHVPDSYQYLQFQIEFTNPNGIRKLRVITSARSTENLSLGNLGLGFDQEAAAVLLARLAVVKCQGGEDSFDVLKWIDRKLIRLATKVGDYQREQPSTFAFPSEFVAFPQYVFYLRRSPFLQTFNASPDETAYYRSVLMREGVRNACLMIMPSLTCYRASGEEPQAVILDVASLTGDVALLCDSFFHVIIWYGETMGQWLDAGYHNQPGYEHFKKAIEAPAEEASALIRSRFPVPKYINCRAGGSQARFLLAKVNPSATHQNRGDGMMGGVDYSGTGAVVLTDDVSIETFIEHLTRLAVSA